MSDESNETPIDASETGPDATALSDEPTDVGAETADTETAGSPATDAKAEAGEKAQADKKAQADAAVAARTVTRRTVTSRRVTPKGGAAAKPSEVAAASGSKARDAKKTETVVTRTAAAPAAQKVYPKGPSPWYVPALMFGLLILGAGLIMLNYSGLIGTADNVRLVIGLGLILGGIIAATQYR